MATPPDFTSGQILTAAQMNAVGMWLVKTQIVGTTVASVNVTSAFSADYDNYKIVYDGGTCSTNVSLNLKIGAATTNYQYAFVVNQYNSTAVVGGGSAAAGSFVEGGRASTVKNNLNVELFGPFLATYTGFRSNSTDYLNSSGFSVHGSGFLNNTTSYSDFTIAPTSGTISGGTIRVYGYRN